MINDLYTRIFQNIKTPNKLFISQEESRDALFIIIGMYNDSSKCFGGLYQEAHELRRTNYELKIRNELLEHQGKFWCLHNWSFISSIFGVGDKFECKKCNKIKFKGE